MSSELELFYFPASYYSQKALLTLFEKNLPFKDRIVYIHFGEQNEEWYLRMNPAGQVPVIKDGNDVIAESEEIIDYIDKKSKQRQLIPDIDTPIGQRVAEVRKLVFAAPIEVITYGVILHPACRTEELEIPKAMLQRFNKETYEKTQRANLASFQKKLNANPTLRDAWASKMEKCQWRIDNMLDPTFIQKTIADLQETFDRIESELKQSIKESSTEDVWLCGTTFTAADIVMAVFMHRLKWVGLAGECYSASKRPLVFAYYKKLFERPAVKRLLSECSIGRTMKLLKWKGVRVAAHKAAKIALAIGCVAAVAYGVKTFMSKQ